MEPRELGVPPWDELVRIALRQCSDHVPQRGERQVDALGLSVSGLGLFLSRLDSLTVDE